MSTANTRYMLIIEYFSPIILSYVLHLVQYDVRILAIHGHDRLWHAQNAILQNGYGSR